MTTLSKPLTTPSANWIFYLIRNGNSTYAGVSPTPELRLRKHNGEIKGGAKYTLSKGPGWSHICLISGFQDKIQALQFEWAVKHIPPRNVGGLEARLMKLNLLLQKERWTMKAPLAATVPLTIEWKLLEAEDIFKTFTTTPNYIFHKLLLR